MNANNNGITSEANAAFKRLAFQFPSKHKYHKQNSILFIKPGPEIHSTFWTTYMIKYNSVLVTDFASRICHKSSLS